MYVVPSFVTEKLENDGNKIIIASKGKLTKKNEDFNFKLFDGNITNIDSKGSINLKFKETIYELSKISSKTRKENKLSETKSSLLIYCLEKYFKKRKDNDFRCGEKNAFLMKDIYEEVFKRIIIPIYLIILSLLSSLSILQPKESILQNYFKIILFFIGFIIILFSELSYKFILSSFGMEIFMIILPIIFIFIFYITLFIKSNFKMSHL